MIEDSIRFSIDAVDKSSGVFSSVNSSLGSIVSTGAKMAAAVVGAASAVTAFTVTMANAMDKQGKFALRLGESVDLLTQYQFVAGQSGVDQDKFNQSVQAMTSRIAEATKGTGEAVGVLKDMGIKARDFAQIPLDQKLELLADKMAGMTSDADRVRTAVKLFGEEGVAMLQMLRGGSDGMRALAADARFLGTNISATAAAQSALFTDELGRVAAATKGLSQGIATELMPIMTGLAQRFANFIASNRGSIVSFVKQALTGFVQLGVVIGQVFDRITGILTDPKIFADFVSNAIDLVPKIGQVMIALAKVMGNGALEAAKITKDTLIGLGGWVVNAAKSLFTGGGTEGLAEALGKVVTEGIARAMSNIGDTVSGVKDVLMTEGAAAGSAFAETFGVNLEAAGVRAQELLGQYSIFAEQVVEQQKVVGEQLTELMVVQQEQQAAFMETLQEASLEFVETLYDTAGGAIDSLSAGLTDAIMTGQSAVVAFEQVAMQTVAAVIQALIKLGIQRLLFSALSGAATKKEAATEGAKSIALAGSNMFASWAAAPWPISMGAPAAAAAAISGASAAFTAGAAAGAGLGAGIGAVAHGGMTNNPDETTMVVQGGERILSPRQNRDLTDALASGGIGGGVQVGALNVTVMPNATNAEALARMDARELGDIISDAVLIALDNMDRQGVRPRFVERGGNV